MTDRAFTYRPILWLLRSSTLRGQRIAALDIFRGSALLAMAGYHFIWDLWYFRFADPALLTAPLWIATRIVILFSFLFFAGFSLQLAHSSGLKLKTFFRRIFLVGLSAISVTLVTYVIAPESFVIFGALHHIAVGSLLAVPFLKLPALLTLISALLTLFLPQVLISDELMRPGWIWLGLSSRVLNSNDFVPVFPWFSAMLTGVAVGRICMINSNWLNRLRNLSFGHSGFTKVLNFLGRHGLIFYLLHQPIFYSVTQLASHLTRPDVVVPYMSPLAYLASCQAETSKDGTRPERARAYCRCNLEEMTKAGIWAAIAEGDVTSSVEEKIADIAETCQAKERDRQNEIYRRQSR